MATLMARYREPGGGFRQKAVRFARNGKPQEFPGATSYFVVYRDNGKRKATAGTTLELALVDLRNMESVEAGAPRLAREFEQHAPKDTTGGTLGQAMEKYLAELQGKAAATVYSYRRAVEEFVRHCGEDHPLATAGRDCLLRYKAALYEQEGLSETTRHNRLLRAVMFLRASGVKAELLRRADWPRSNEKAPDAYTREELDAMLRAAGPDDRLLLEFLLYSGVRDLEAAHAAVADIRVTRGAAVLTVREKPELGWRTKGARDRQVRLPLEFAQRLLAAREGKAPESLLFPNGDGYPDMHLLRRVKRVAAAAKVRGANLHKFRRTFATMMSAHAGIQDIRAALGHRDIATTMHYLEAAAPESERAGKAAEAAFGKLAGD